MYTLKAEDFKPTGVKDELEIEIDITQLKDFTAFDLADVNLLMYKYGFGLEEMQKLIKQSNTSFKHFRYGKRVPVLLPVPAYKLGRVISKNIDLIEIVGDIPTGVAQEMSNGILYEISTEKGDSDMVSYITANFKLSYTNGSYQYIE